MAFVNLKNSAPIEVFGNIGGGSNPGYEKVTWALDKQTTSADEIFAGTYLDTNFIFLGEEKPLVDKLSGTVEKNGVSYPITISSSKIAGEEDISYSGLGDEVTMYDGKITINGLDYRMSNMLIYINGVSEVAKDRMLFHDGLFACIGVSAQYEAMSKARYILSGSDIVVSDDFKDAVSKADSSHLIIRSTEENGSYSDSDYTSSQIISELANGHIPVLILTSGSFEYAYYFGNTGLNMGNPEVVFYNNNNEETPILYVDKDGKVDKYMG